MQLKIKPIHILAEIQVFSPYSGIGRRPPAAPPPRPAQKQQRPRETLPPPPPLPPGPFIR